MREKKEKGKEENRIKERIERESEKKRIEEMKKEWDKMK